MTKPQIAGPLAATLDVVAEGCADLADPWWVFGSAGMALVGVPGLSPPDVDLIVSARDARTLLDRWNTPPLEAAGSPLFRSAIFAKAQVAPLPIEIMAGFEAFTDGGWRLVIPASRQSVDWNGKRLFTPSAAEQAAICRRFGRPKDLARVALLEAIA
jgi:hypothetical protein